MSMTNTRVFTPEVTLKKVLNDTFGQTAEELAAASQTLLTGMTASLCKVLQEDVARLAALRASGEADVLSRTVELSHLAMSIVEVAGAAGRHHLGEAARGILAMTDALPGASAAHKEALMVHVGAVTLLGAEPPPPHQEAESVVRQLSAMRRFVGVMD